VDLNLRNKVIFLTPNSNNNYTKNVDLILSPEYYWIRTFNIPLKKKKDVLSVVPTYFEDYIDIEGYKFYIKELEENKYLCFAYKEDTIFQAIESANLKSSQISNIYFAQNEFVDQKSFKMEDNYFIYQDEILLKVPKEFIDHTNVENYDIENINLSKYKITINKVNKYIDNKSLYILSTIFLTVAIINFAKINDINNTISSFEIQQNKMKKDYKMLPSMMQTNSLIKTLENKQKEQRKLRDDLFITFNKNKKINRIYLQNGKVKYE